MKRLSLILLPLFLLTSCASDNNDEAFQRTLNRTWQGYFKEDYNDTRTVNVMVATNRKMSGTFGCGNEQFSTAADSEVRFGICGVNIPKNHGTGVITLAKDSRQSSHDFFKFLHAQNSEKAQWIKALKDSKRIPLVFVHGFNVKYQEAILRAGQIAYDLKYQGPVVLFTWPSGAGNGFFDEAMMSRTYENNLANAKTSVAAFKEFLVELKKNGIKVNLLVHSMGHQVVLPALKELGEQSRTTYINELILNAPDFESAEFVSLASHIKPTSKRITLYCSYNDKAMFASKTMNKTERLGACTYLEDFDSINVSLVDDPTVGLGHGYYASRAILSDVFQVLLGIDAEKRLFMRKSEPNSTEKYFLRQ